MKDDLGRQMKRDYEDALRFTLPRGAYVIVRIDGRAFHTFTRTMERPYCRALAHSLDQAAIRLCQEMIGCRFAYGQSDEYSFLLTDFGVDDTPLWFAGNVQKIVSVSASLFTAAFHQSFASSGLTAPGLAVFDSRIILIPRRAEAAKYFVWRQLDASANSLNMLASAHYSHAELLGKTNAEKHEMLHARGINWAHQPADFKRGRTILPAPAWHVDDAIPVFTRAPDYLEALLP